MYDYIESKRSVSIYIYIYILTIIITSIGFYLTVSHTPLYADDYDYSYFNAPEEIKSEFPLFLPIYTQYFAGVGRFIPHNFVALFQLIAGKWLFDIMSTFGYIILCVLMARVVTNNRFLLLVTTLFNISMLWLFIAGFFHALMWMSGACNYLFPAILILSFYLSLRSERYYDLKWYKLILWGIFGFIVGWTNEGFVVGFSVGILYYYMTHFRELNLRRNAMLIGFLLGVIFLCLSPLNLHRFFSGNNTPFSFKSVISSILAMNNLRVTYGLIIGILIIIILGNKKRFMEFVDRYIVFIISFIVSFLFLIITRHGSEYSRFPVEFFATILFTALVVFYLPRIIIGATWILSTITVVTMIMIIPKCIDNYEAYDSMVRQIHDGNKLIIAENVEIDNYQKRYIKPISDIYHSWVMYNNEIVEFYGGDPTSTILSKDMYTRMNECENCKRIYDRRWGFSLIEIPNSGKVDKIIFKLKPFDFQKYPWIYAIILSKLDRYNINEVTANRYKYIMVNGRKWLLLLDNEMVNNRLKAIKIIYSDVMAN